MIKMASCHEVGLSYLRNIRQMLGNSNGVRPVQILLLEYILVYYRKTLMGLKLLDKIVSHMASQKVHIMSHRC